MKQKLLFLIAVLALAITTTQKTEAATLINYTIEPDSATNWTIYDNSGNNLHCNQENRSYFNESSGSIVFDRSSRSGWLCDNTTTILNLSPAQGWTVQGHFVSQNATQKQILFFWGYSSGTNNGTQLVLTNSGRFQINNGTSAIVSGSNMSYSNGQATYFAASYNATGSTLTYCFNQTCATSAFTALPFNNQLGIWIGTDHGGNDFNGSILDLTVEDVSYNYQDLNNRSLYAKPTGNPNTTVTTNFATSTATVQDIGFGLNTGAECWGGNNTYIDTNNDGNKDTLVNTAEIRNAIIDLGVKWMRCDERLDAFEGNNFTTVANSNGRNMDNKVSWAAWSIQNNITPVFVIDYMPAELANNSTDCTGSPTKCAPLSNDAFASRQVNFTNALETGLDTALGSGDWVKNYVHFEMWNEPDQPQFFLPGLAYFNSARTTYYLGMYNATYNAMQAAYSGVNFGASSMSDDTVMRNSFYGNMSGRYSWVEHHEYPQRTEGDADWFMQNKSIPLITSTCLLNGNCGNKPLRLGEYNRPRDNTYSLPFANSSEQQSIQVALIALTALKYNYTPNFYLLTTANNCTLNTNNFCAFSPSQLENTNYSVYAQLKNFSRYYKNGYSIATTTSTNNKTVFAIAGGNNTNKTLTIINKGSTTTTINYTITGLSNPYRLVGSNGSSYLWNSGTSQFASISLASLQSDNYELQVSDLSFSSYFPTSDSTIDAGGSQLFNFSLNNIASLPYNATWYVDGINQTLCFNQSSCTLSTNIPSTYTVNLQIESRSNNLSQSWSMVVLGDETSICNNILTGFGNFSNQWSMIGTIVSLLMIFGVIGGVGMIVFGKNNIEGTQAFFSLVVGFGILVMFVVGIVILAGGVCT